MKAARLMMGMPITIEVVDASATEAMIDKIFDYFQYVDETFSPFKPSSEVSRLNDHRLERAGASADVQTILQLAAETKEATDGFFDIERNEQIDPSGIVKGWAIQSAADQLGAMGLNNYYVDAGGDIAAIGHNASGQPWRVGIRNPWQLGTLVKVVQLSDRGIATSGTYIRGDHVYDPHTGQPATEIVSLTVIADTVFNADRFATAALAMGRGGIGWLERQAGLEGYQIDQTHQAVMTSGFEQYLVTT